MNSAREESHREELLPEEMTVQKYKHFLVGAAVGAVATGVALRYHVIRYQDGVMLVPRTSQPPLMSAYADIRSWGTVQWKEYPDVAEALVKDGHSKLIAERVAMDLLRSRGTLQPNLEPASDEVSTVPVSVFSKEATTPAVSLEESRIEPIPAPAPPRRIEPPALPTFNLDEESVRAQEKQAVNPTPAPVQIESQPTAARKSFLEQFFGSGSPESTVPKAEPVGRAPATEIPAGDKPVASNSGGGPLTASNESTGPVRQVSKPVTSPTAKSGSQTFVDLESLDIELGQPAAGGPPAPIPRPASTEPDSSAQPIKSL
jgi:hypothetical protein